MNEWIVRVMPLPTASGADTDSPRDVVLSRFRIRIVAPNMRVGPRLAGDRMSVVDVGDVRVIGLDSTNPHGGVGGSLDSDQAAWLVRQLDGARDRYVIVASHDSSLTMTSDTTPDGQPPRILGAEFSSLLLAHPHVVGWVSATMHHRAGRRHGDASYGFWELPGATEGRDAPLAGGLVLLRRSHRGAVMMRGALAGAGRSVWELRDPFAVSTSGPSPAPAVAPH